MVIERKKSAGQIIRDDMKRRRLRRVGLGLFFFGILPMFGITLNRVEGEIAGVISLGGLGVSLAGCIMVAISTKCPICDSGIYRSGACRCQPSRAARSAYIADLKWRAAGSDSGGGS